VGSDLSPAAMLALQKRVGNAAVGEMLRARAARGGAAVPGGRPPASGALRIQRQPDDRDGGAPATQPQDGGRDQGPVPAGPSGSVQTVAPPPPPAGDTGSAGAAGAPATTPDTGAGQPASGPGPDVMAANGAAAAQLLQEVALQKASVHQIGEERKARIAAAGEERKTAIQQAIDAEATRLDTAYDTAAQRIQAALTQGRNLLTGQRDAQIAATRAAADAEIGRLQQTVADQQAAVTAAGDTRAAAAREAGEQEARRANEGAQASAGRAEGIGEAKAAQYAGAKEAAKIAEIARKLASEVAGKARSEGAKLGQAVFKMGDDLAAHFRGDASDASAQYTKILTSRTEKITKARDAAVDRIGDLASQTISKLEGQASDATDKLQGTRADTVQQVRALAAPGSAAIDQVVQSAQAQVDQATTALDGQLDQFAADATPRVDQAHGPRAETVLQGLLAQVRQTTPEYTSAMDGLVTSAGTAMDQQVDEVRSTASTGVDGASAPLQDAAGGFERSAADVAGKTGQEMEKAASDATTDMRKTVDDTAADLQGATAKAATRWDGELDDAKAEMRTRVDAGLDRIGKTVDDLGPKIDSEAADLSKEGFWSQVGSFFKNAGAFLLGVVAGFLEAIGEMVVGLVKLVAAYVMALVHGSFIVWFLTIVVVALLVLIFIFAGGWVGVGIFIGALLLAAGIVLAVMGFIRMLQFLRDAFKPGLSWFERGRLIGHAIFEGLMSVLIVAGWLKAGRLGELGEGGAEGGEVAKIGELSEFLKAARAGLKDPKALEQFDAMWERMGKDSGKMEPAIKELSKDGDLEQKLIDAWNREHPTFTPPPEELVKLIDEQLAKADKLDERITAYERDHPDVEGIKRWKARVDDQRTALSRERTGEIKTSKGKIDEHGRNLKTLESEIDTAEGTPGVVEVNKPVSSGALTSEVDVVSADGKVWTDNKDFSKTFGPQSDRFAKLKAQAEQQVKISQDPKYTLPDGTQPQVVYHFTNGVDEASAAALEAQVPGLKVTGTRIPSPGPGGGAAPP
jgi:colicin import membrane protein